MHVRKCLIISLCLLLLILTTEAKLVKKGGGNFKTALANTKNMSRSERSFDFMAMDEEVRIYNKKVEDCREANVSGIYQIKIPGIAKMVQVRCESKYLKGGWIVIQRRYTGEENFFRPWNQYKVGFGDLESEFWFGLEKIHLLTIKNRYELMIVLQSFKDRKGYAKYDHFVIGSEKTNYELEKLGTYVGEAGNSMQVHLGKKFTTYDKNNHGGKIENCALSGHGAWWYNECYLSNLLGKYPDEYESTQWCKRCMNWLSFDLEPMKSVQMMIRTNYEESWES